MTETRPMEPVWIAGGYGPPGSQSNSPNSHTVFCYYHFYYYKTCPREQNLLAAARILIAISFYFIAMLEVGFCVYEIGGDKWRQVLLCKWI